MIINPLQQFSVVFLLSLKIFTWSLSIEDLLRSFAKTKDLRMKSFSWSSKKFFQFSRITRSVHIFHIHYSIHLPLTCVIFWLFNCIYNPFGPSSLICFARYRLRCHRLWHARFSHCLGGLSARKLLYRTAWLGTSSVHHDATSSAPQQQHHVVHVAGNLLESVDCRLHLMWPQSLLQLPCCHICMCLIIINKLLPRLLHCCSCCCCAPSA